MSLISNNPSLSQPRQSVPNVVANYKKSLAKLELALKELVSTEPTITRNQQTQNLTNPSVGVYLLLASGH
jgi:hypothetical protein